VAKLGFHPKRHGYHFPDSFVTRVLPGALNVQTSGLCGGMATSALDHWRALIPIPTHREDDFEPPPTPHEGKVPSESSSLRIGRKVPHGPYSAQAPVESKLRINDDTPANGAGQFQCHVEVWR
jgi:hypothetical protein